MATPTGVITIWYGTSGSIPSGWVLCDGSNDTPDLRSHFVMGASGDGEVGTTSGSNTHLHSSAPSLSSAGSHNHSLSGSTNSQTGGTSQGAGTAGTYRKSTSHSHSYSGTAATEGGHTHTVGVSESSAVLPPYVKLYYIMKT